MQGGNNPRPGFISSMQHFFGHQSSTNITNKLYALRKDSDNDDWARKAIEYVVKKLKKKNDGSLQNLEFALNHPTIPSNCVTIPRNQDDRLQIFYKKSLPHVIFCRLWRWPELKSHHELKAIKDCEYPYSKGHHEREVCVNPYHYMRSITASLPPIEIPMFSPAIPEQPINMSQYQRFAGQQQHSYQSYNPGTSQMEANNASVPSLSPVLPQCSYQGMNQVGGTASIPSSSPIHNNSNAQYYQGTNSMESAAHNFLMSKNFSQMDLAALIPHQKAMVPQMDHHYENYSPSPQSNNSHGSHGYHSASPLSSPDSCQEYPLNLHQVSWTF